MIQRKKTKVAWPRLHYAKLTKTLLITAAILCALSGIPANATPLPHAVSGVLTSGDEPVKDLLLVEARINGKLFAATHTKDGRFGYEPYFKVPADDPSTPQTEGGRDGDTVKLYLDGTLFLEFVFESGRISNFVEDVSSLYNEPPLAVTSTELRGVIGYSLLLDARGSYDPNDSQLTYKWSHDDGTQSTGALASHTYHQEGTHTTTLTVSDPQGLTDTATVTVNIEYPPEPTNWMHTTVEGGKQAEIVTDDDTISFWLTVLDGMPMTIIEYGDAFLRNNLPNRHGSVFSLTCDYSNLVHPVYLEAAIPEEMLGLGDNVRLFTWKNGGWAPIPSSGKMDKNQKLWAYLDEDTVGQGLYLVGFDPSDPTPRVTEVITEADNNPLSMTAFLGAVDPDAKLFLRIDNKLVDSRQITAYEISFQHVCQPGKHEFKVNGFSGEVMVHSDENKYLVLALGALPVTLLSLIFKKFS